MNFETSQNGIPQSCFCRHCQNFVRAFGAAPASPSMKSPAHELCVSVHIAHDRRGFSAEFAGRQAGFRVIEVVHRLERSLPYRTPNRSTTRLQALARRRS